jgi:hypothetical protein
LVKGVTDIRVTLRNLRTGHVSGVWRDRMKPGRKGYFLAMDPEIMAEVHKQLLEAKKRQPALFAGHHPPTAKPNGSIEQRVNGMKSRRCKGLGGRGGNIAMVEEIESLVDLGDRWKELNSCSKELSTYMFGGVPGFTSRL